MSNWIDVKKSLPSDSEEVWIFDGEYGVCIGNYFEDHWSGNNDPEDPTQYYQVTHWRPFFRPPPPPKLKDNTFTMRVSDFDLENINELAKRLGRNKGEAIRLIIKEVLNGLRDEELNKK